MRGLYTERQGNMECGISHEDQNILYQMGITNYLGNHIYKRKSRTVIHRCRKVEHHIKGWYISELSR
jgi:hypothetical protein